MIAKQYTTRLPADYDMQIVRRRVADRHAAFDELDGLGVKAWLITETAAGATANRYCSFYLWNEAEGIDRFLFGNGFAGILDSFGRPAVEHWIGMDTRVGVAASARCATREDVLVSADQDLRELREHECAWLDECVDDPRGLVVAAVAIDPLRWQLVRLAVWSVGTADIVPSPAVTTYEALHLSRPGIDALRQT
jgi:Domain of unknown function (DUF4865)